MEEEKDFSRWNGIVMDMEAKHTKQVWEPYKNSFVRAIIIS